MERTKLADGLMDGVGLRGEMGEVQGKDRVSGLRVEPSPTIKVTPDSLPR